MVKNRGRVVEHHTFGRGDRGSEPPVLERRTFQLKGPRFKTTSAISRLGQLRLPHFAFVFGKRQ